MTETKKVKSSPSHSPEQLRFPFEETRGQVREIFSVEAEKKYKLPYEKVDLPLPSKLTDKWKQWAEMQKQGVDMTEIYDEKRKLKEIVEFFKFKDMDDATRRLHEVILHHHQETFSVPKEERPKDKNGKWIMPRHHVQASPALTDLIFERIQEAKTNHSNYRPPIVGCGRFCYLLAKIGEQFGHRLGVITNTEVDYYKADGESHTSVGHMLNYDETDGVYRDGAIYKNWTVRDPASNKRKWIHNQKNPPDFSTNIPAEWMHPEKGKKLGHFDPKTSEIVWGTERTDGNTK
jgi:hypothetical protein